MAAKVLGASASRSTSQAKAAANSGDSPTVNTTLATVVSNIARMNSEKAPARQAAAIRPLRPTARNAAPVPAP
jgi:hypothetical protein